MAKTVIHWDWQEAFHKYGFYDGDGWNGSYLVGDILENVGCELEYCDGGIHNTYIEKVIFMDETYEFNGLSDPVQILPKILVFTLNNYFNNFTYEMK